MKSKVKVYLVELILSFVTMLVLHGTSIAICPDNIKLVEKEQASYDTPENSITSFISAHMADDLSWHYQTLTRESVEKEITDFDKNNLDPRAGMKIFQNGFSTACIEDSFNYLDMTIVVVKITDVNGDIFTIPYTLVEEDEKLKVTKTYYLDDELAKYMKYEPKLFYGKGQRPTDVNAFLAYHYPQEATTTLSAGTSTFDLHIFFGATINPKTFSATLDDQDISNLFSPSPSNDQMVTIKFKPGRNVILLSVDGIRSDGKTATDSDRLVFIVR